MNIFPKKEKSIDDIIVWFIQRYNVDGNDITLLKLQKLVYIFNGFYMAFEIEKGKPYFSDQCKGWKYGPVYSRLYGHFATFGSTPITDLLGMKGKVTCKTTRNLLEKVHQLTKEFTAIDLTNFCVKEGSAWNLCYDDDGSDDSHSIVIPNKIIKTSFKKYIKQDNLCPNP